MQVACSDTRLVAEVAARDAASDSQFCLASDARQCLQWMTRAILASGQQKDIDLLLPGWIHSIALTTTNELKYRIATTPDTNTCLGVDSMLEHVSLEARCNSKNGDELELLTLVPTQRVEILFSTFETKGSDESSSPSLLWNLPSELFRFLLHLYLVGSSTDPSLQSAAVEQLGLSYRVAVMVVLPMICDRFQSESLLFGDVQTTGVAAGEPPLALGLLKMIKLMLHSTTS